MPGCKISTLKKNPLLFHLIILDLFLAGCQSAQNDNVTGSPNEVPEFRKSVSPAPVAAYREKTDDKLNDWYFSVKLFETKKTFYYLLKMQYQEIRVEDTLKIPDFGVEPKPAIQKGKDRYSCIIGFMDNENKFREYKLVSVRNGQELKLTTINYYTVVNKP